MPSRRTKRVLEEHPYGAICWNCGSKEFHNIDNSKMEGITMYIGICPRCGKTATLIPIRDFEYATGLTNVWD
jgi:hypothetical protein